MFIVGDVIKQNHQHNAPNRQVIGHAPNGSSIVWDERLRKVRWVHNWSHTKVSHTEISDSERINKLNHPSHMKWILGKQHA